MAKETQITESAGKSKTPAKSNGRKNAVKPAAPKKTGKALKRFKRRLSFLIFLAAAGTAFYLGLVSLKVPEGYGVLIHSKIQFKKGHDGYEDRIIPSGEFIWRFQGIIPTALTQHLIPLNYRNGSASLSGHLPSGDIYLDHAGIQDDFHYKLTVNLQYRLKESFIIDQVRKGLLDPEKIEDYYRQLDQDIAAYILQNQMTVNLLPPDELAESEDLPLDWEQLKINTAGHFPQLEVEQIRLISQDVPDLYLYKELRSQYLIYLQEKNRVQTEMALETETRENLIKEKLDLMEQYGQLITQYPLLLDFFSMDKGANWDQLNPEFLLNP